MNLAIVVLDCLRRDYWRRMPRARATTAGWFHLDNHWAVAHCSDPNHAALFTGYGPWETKITTQMGVQWTQELPTLFWRWKRDFDGYVCALQPLRVPAFYRMYVDDLAWHKDTDSADLELRAVRTFLDTAGRRRLLLFVRDMTCHYPYLDLPMPPRGEAAEIRPQYEAAVEHVDEFLDRLVDLLLSRQPDTIIVVCSDHGELLGEHGEYDHLYTLYSYLVRTPMAVYVPNLAGRRTDAPTQHIDVWPTLCELLDLAPQGEGISWATWMRGEVHAPAPRERRLWLQGTGAGPVSEKHLEARGNLALDPGLGRVVWRHRGVVWGSWKLVQDVHADGQVVERLTRPKDYTEREDYAGRQTRVAQRLRNSLPSVPDYYNWEQELLDHRRQAQDAIILERLQALGYA